MNKGFETWQRLPETFDGLFSSGNAGPAEIVKAPDGRSEFVKLPNGQALVTFPSSSVPAYYPLRRYLPAQGQGRPHGPGRHQHPERELLGVDH